MTKEKEPKDELKKITTAEMVLQRWADDQSARTDRFNRYLAYFTHLEAEQWAQKEIPAGDRPKISLFLSTDTIRNYRAKLFPGRAAVGVKVYPENKNQTEEEETAKFENHILETYSNNELAVILAEQSKWFFVGGEACFFAPHNPAKTPGKDAETFIFSLDPTTVTIGLIGNLKFYGMHEQTISAQQARQLDWCHLDQNIKDSEMLSDIYYFDLQYYVRIINQDKENAKVLPNPYDPEFKIPYFWIPNNSKPGSREGQSELRHLRILDKEFNFRISDYAQRLRGAVLGPIFVSGAGTNKNISLDNDFINFLAPGGKAERLGLPGDGQEYLNYFEFLLKIYQGKTAITDTVMGTKEAQSASSGIALQYKFLNLQELIDEKRIMWDSNIKKLNKTILYYKFGSGKKYRNEPIYQNAMPQDETVKVNNNIAAVQAGLKPRETAIDEINPHLAAGTALEKIDEDMKKNPDLYKKTSAPFGNDKIVSKNKNN